MLRRMMGLLGMLASLAMGSEKFPYVVRATGGVGAGSMGPAIDLRLLGGMESSSFRYGLQATAMQRVEITSNSQSERLNVNGTDQVSSFNAVVGWELSPQGPYSVVVFLGPGVANSSMGSPHSPDSYRPSSAETIHSTDPSLLTGVDLGVSLWRHVGLSLQLGALASKESGVYALLQLDAGKW